MGRIAAVGSLKGGNPFKCVRIHAYGTEVGTVVPTKSLFLAEVQRHELFEITFQIKGFVDDTIVSSALSILKLSPLSCEA
jgi:hypothetical protein